MVRKKKVSAPDTSNSLMDWSDVIHKIGEESRKKQAQERKDQANWMLNYFSEAHRVKDLGEDQLLSWEGASPTLNSRFADEILGNERVLQEIWNEVAHRVQFNELLKLSLER